MTASSMAPTYHLFVGVDSAATSFAATWTHGGPARERVQTFDQTPDGFLACQRWLATTGVAPDATLVVVEATGSYVEAGDGGRLVLLVREAVHHQHAGPQGVPALAVPAGDAVGGVPSIRLKAPVQREAGAWVVSYRGQVLIILVARLLCNRPEARRRAGAEPR